MSRFTSRFASTKQDWETPPEFFDRLNKEFNFTIDLAASEENAKCPNFLSAEDDAMDCDWLGTGWLNPPYGSIGKYRLSEWIKKSYNESVEHGSTIVLLTPARTNTNWWHDYCMKAKEIRFVRGRPKFVGADHGLPQPLAIVIFQVTESPIVVSSFNA